MVNYRCVLIHLLIYEGSTELSSVQNPCVKEPIFKVSRAVTICLDALDATVFATRTGTCFFFPTKMGGESPNSLAFHIFQFTSFNYDDQWSAMNVVPYCQTSTHVFNGHFRNLNWRYLPYIFGLFFRPKFQGISPENMAKHMVRLRTSILGSWNYHPAIEPHVWTPKNICHKPKR